MSAKNPPWRVDVQHQRVQILDRHCVQVLPLTLDEEEIARTIVQAVNAFEPMREALMAAKLHLMVRPPQRMPGAEQNVRDLISDALEDGHVAGEKKA